MFYLKKSYAYDAFKQALPTDWFRPAIFTRIFKNLGCPSRYIIYFVRTEWDEPKLIYKSYKIANDSIQFKLSEYFKIFSK